MRRGLALFDERYMKLDAGDPMTYVRINGRGSFGAVVDALRDLPRIIVQAMFVRDDRGDVDNTTDRAVAAWLDVVDAIQPSRVHVYTIARPPAFGHLQTRTCTAIARDCRARASQPVFRQTSSVDRTRRSTK